MALGNRKSTAKTRKVKQEKDMRIEEDALSFNKPKLEEVKLMQVSVPKAKELGDSLLAFSFEKPIYLQINRQNLFQYFVSGLLVPTAYDKNRTQYDIQSIFGDYLQLSNGFLDTPKSTDALVELVLIKDEEKELVIHSSIALLSKPIPVSRIKKIYVQSQTGKDEILAIATTADAGIIPEALIESSFPANVDLIIHDEHVTPEEIRVDYKDKISKYDRVLGAYSFVRNISVLCSNKTNTYSNIPDHYLGFVGILLNNKVIHVETNTKHQNFYKQLLGIHFKDENIILKWLFARASSEINFTSSDIIEFGNILLKNHPDQAFKEEGKEALNILNDGIRRKSAPRFILDIKHIDKVYLYLFSYLYIYGNRTSEDRTNSRIGLSNEVAPMYAEFVFSLLGFFYGYSLLRNRDEKQSYKDAVINNFSKNFDRPSIKFELNTFFDFCLIESVYQFVFNDVVPSNDFAYIDISFPKGIINVPRLLPDNYEFSNYELLGKQFYKLKKKSLADDLAKKLSSMPDNIPLFSEIGLYCLHNGLRFSWNLNTLVSGANEVRKINEIARISKADLIEHIYSSRCNYEELAYRIEASIKQKDQE